MSIFEYNQELHEKTLYGEGYEDGETKGIERTASILKDLGLPPQTILAKIQEQYHLTPEASKKYL